MWCRALGKWIVALEASGHVINWWERDEGGESFEFAEGGDTFELRRGNSDYYVVLFLVHGMTFSLRTAVGEALATRFNDWADQDVVQIDHDEDFVIHLVTMARVGSVRKASETRLDLAISACRSLRDMFMADTLVALESAGEDQVLSPPSPPLMLDSELP